MDLDTGIGGPHGRFPSTQLSLLEAVASGLSNDALDQVIALYWKPVYRFVRLKFHKDNEDAKDLTQGFFTSALERDFFTTFDPARASFRTYIRMAVERYAANQHAAANRQKRGGNVEFETIADQAISTESPEQIFEREWQRQLFSLAIEDLRRHCGENNKKLHFEMFEAYDLSDGARPSYGELASQHGVMETTVTNHLAWARRMLRGFVTDRLRGTTSSSQELHQEARRLWI